MKRVRDKGIKHVSGMKHVRECEMYMKRVTHYRDYTRLRRGKKGNVISGRYALIGSWLVTVRVVQLRVNSGTTGVTVLDGTLASAYVLRPCCCSCSVFRRCRRQIEKERRRGVILVDIQAKVHSGVSTSLYTEAKVD